MRRHALGIPSGIINHTHCQRKTHLNPNISPECLQRAAVNLNASLTVVFSSKHLRILQLCAAGTNILLLHAVPSQRAGSARQPPASARSAPASWIRYQQTENAIRSFRSCVPQRSPTFRQFDSFPSLSQLRLSLLGSVTM